MIGKRAGKMNGLLEDLFKREANKPIKANYLSGQSVMTPTKRALLVDWMCRAHMRLKLRGRTFQKAVGLLDEYLQIMPAANSSEVCVLGVASLCLATSKEQPEAVSYDRFSNFAGHHTTYQEIQVMEQIMLTVLNHDFSRPIPLDFATKFTELGKFSTSHFLMSSYFVELALCLYAFCSIPPSKVAAAALLLAIHLINKNNKEPSGFNKKYWTSKLAKMTGYSATDLHPIVRMLGATARKAPKMAIKAVYLKYQTEECHMVSKRDELNSVLMDSIIGQL